MRDKLANNISIFELRAFDAVATHRSVRGAARQLGLEPAHVSKVLSRLEHKLGQQLIIRHPGGVMLARDGLALAERLKDFLLAASQLLEPTEPAAAVATLPVITLGSLTYVNQAIVTAAFPAMADLLNRIRLRVIDLPPDMLPKIADRAGFDLVIHARSDAWSRQWHVQSLGKIRWGLFARMGHRLGRTATLAEVLRFPFIVPTYWQDEGYAIGDDLFPEPWARRIRGHEASSASTAFQIAMASDQLVFAPSILMRVYGVVGQIQEVDIRGMTAPTRTLHLMTRSDTVPASVQKPLVRAIKNVLAGG